MLQVWPPAPWPGRSPPTLGPSPALLGGCIQHLPAHPRAAFWPCRRVWRRQGQACPRRACSAWAQLRQPSLEPSSSRKEGGGPRIPQAHQPLFHFTRRLPHQLLLPGLEQNPERLILTSKGPLPQPGLLECVGRPWFTCPCGLRLGGRRRRREGLADPPGALSWAGGWPFQPFPRLCSYLRLFSGRFRAPSSLRPPSAPLSWAQAPTP